MIHPVCSKYFSPFSPNKLQCCYVGKTVLKKLKDSLIKILILIISQEIKISILLISVTRRRMG